MAIMPPQLHPAAPNLTDSKTAQSRSASIASSNSSDAGEPSTRDRSASSTPPSSAPLTPRLPDFELDGSLGEKISHALGFEDDSTSFQLDSSLGEKISHALGLERDKASFELPPLIAAPATPRPTPPATPSPAPVERTLPLPSAMMPGAYTPQPAPVSPHALPGIKLAAELLAHDRTLHLDEPLHSGQFDLAGLGWERIYGPLGHVTVDVKPETHASVHVLLKEQGAPLALPQMLAATIALWAASIAHVLLSFLGRNDVGTAGATASKIGANKVVVEEVALRFSEPVSAFPAGWNPQRLRVEFDGATVNSRGEVVPEGRLKLFNFVSIPGVGLARHILPQLNVDGDALARDGLFKLGAPKAARDLSKKTKLKAKIPGGGVAGLLQDVLPETMRLSASGPKGSEPITFPLSLGALGAPHEVLVEVLPHAAQWQLELDTQKKGTPDARLVASVSATLHNGKDHQAQIQLALGATTAPGRWPLTTGVPGLGDEHLAPLAQSVPPAGSKLGQLLDRLNKAPELQAHVVVGTRLPGEQTFMNLLGDLHLASQHLDSQHTRLRVVQGTPSAERTQMLADALGIELPVLTDLGQRIAGLEAQVTLAHPARKAG